MRRVAVLGMMLLGWGGCSPSSSSSTVVLRGQVLSERQTPVPGVQVVAQMVEEGAGGTPRFAPEVATTGADGRFALEIPLAGVVDDPTNPTGLIPAVAGDVLLRMEYLSRSGVECDTTSVPGTTIQWDVYSFLTLTKTVPLEGEDVDLGTISLEEFTETNQFRYGRVVDRCQFGG